MPRNLFLWVIFQSWNTLDSHWASSGQRELSLVLNLPLIKHSNFKSLPPSQSSFSSLRFPSFLPLFSHPHSFPFSLPSFLNHFQSVCYILSCWFLRYKDKRYFDLERGLGKIQWESDHVIHVPCHSDSPWLSPGQNLITQSVLFFHLMTWRKRILNTGS